MMLSRAPLTRAEVFAYAMLVLGILGDHLSTSFALRRGNMMEANPMAYTLMQQGLWVQTDIFLIVLSIAATFTSLRVMKSPMVRITLFLPFLVGFIRLAVTFWNFSLII